MQRAFQSEAELKRNLNINTFTSADVPEFLTEEKAKEIRDEINGIVDKLLEKKTKEDDVFGKGGKICRLVTWRTLRYWKERVLG